MATNTLGRYQIIREIARSNDIVYEARDPTMGRRVAVKELTLPPSLVGQARRERIERFQREARAAGRLSENPRIVTIYDYGVDGDRYYIVMEYLEGRPLRDILQMEGALPVERARRIAAQACDALQYAHERGVIHRDIKPDNIHILPDDTVKITDFGIARIAADPSLTADGQVFGTPSYMSPEQVAGKPLDARTDLYSLGVTLFEMVTGRKPFVGDSVVTITYNIMNQEPPTMTGVPPDVQQVVRRAMVKAPDGRFRTASEMRDALLSARTPTGSMAAARLGPPPPVLPGAGAPPAGPPPGNVATQMPDARGPAPAQRSGPEPTPIDPPPVYVPRRPSVVARLVRSQGTFLSMLALAVVLSLAVAFFFWAATTAYQNYQRGAREAQAQTSLHRGVSFFNARRYQEAVAEFRHAMEIAPGTDSARIAAGNAAAAYINMGNASLDDRQWASAAQAYSAALQFDPQSPGAHYGLGMAYHNQNRGTEAMLQWDWVLNNPPAGGEARKQWESVAGQARHNLAIAYFNQGTADYNAGRYDEADTHWGRAADTEPGSDIARQAIALRQQLLDRMRY